MKTDLIGRVAGSDRGSSFVEVMAAMLILTLATLGLVRLTGQAIRLQLLAREASRMTAVAEYKMEELMSRPFEDLTPGGSVSTMASGFSEQREAVAGVPLNLRWEITTVASGLKLIRLRVDASTAVPAPRQVDLASYLSAAGHYR